MSQDEQAFPVCRASYFVTSLAVLLFLVPMSTVFLLVYRVKGEAAMLVAAAVCIYYILKAFLHLFIKKPEKIELNNKGVRVVNNVQPNRVISWDDIAFIKKTWLGSLRLLSKDKKTLYVIYAPLLKGAEDLRMHDVKFRETTGKYAREWVSINRGEITLQDFAMPSDQIYQTLMPFVNAAHEKTRQHKS